MSLIRTCFTAIIILFPKTAFVFAFLASVFDFVAARTAAARPMNSGETGEDRCSTLFRLVKGETEKAATPDSASAITKIGRIIMVASRI